MLDLTDEEIAELINADTDTFIRELSKHPALKDRVHRYHKQAIHLWNMAHGIDKKSREQQRQAQQTQTPPEILQERARIQNSVEFKDRLHKNHKQAHRDWLATFQDNEVLK